MPSLRHDALTHPAMAARQGTKHHWFTGARNRARSGALVKRCARFAALNNMTTCQVIDHVGKLQCIRQVYHICLERDGPDHERTRMLRTYIAQLEARELQTQLPS